MRSTKPTVYQRIIDFDIEQGNIDSAKSNINLGLDKKIEIQSTNPATVELIAKVRVERKLREADALARKAEEAKRKEDERVAEAKRKEEERSRAPRHSVEIQDIRIVPFRTANGVSTSIVYVDWKNTGNRPVRALWAKFTTFDSRKNEIDVFPKFDLCIYAVVANDRPGIAPGSTYTAPSGEGKIIPPLDNNRVARVVVTISKIEENVSE